MKTVKVLKPGILMGEVREFGDELPKDKFFNLPINVQNSLIGANHVEIVDDETISDEDRFDAIEKRMAHLESLVFGTTNIANEVKITDIVLPSIVLPSKGNKVSFTDNGVEVTGVITSIAKKGEVARVKTEDGQKFAVNFGEITIIE